MAALGYRQALDALRGRCTEAEAEARVVQLTRQYAKRQITWLRREPGAVFTAPPYAEVWSAADASGG